MTDAEDQSVGVLAEAALSRRGTRTPEMSSQDRQPLDIARKRLPANRLTAAPPVGSAPGFPTKPHRDRRRIMASLPRNPIPPDFTMEPT